MERVRPERDGTLTVERIAAACREDTALVSVMLVNNETGARHPLETLVPEIRRISPRALIHTDAVQAAGRIPLSAERMGVDLLTVSGHKLHAPKGVGALYVRKGVRLLPRQIGGGQEDGLRSGTEAAPAIAAFGAAAAAVPPFREQEALYRRLRDRLLERLSPLGVFHLPPEGVPYIVSLSLPGLRSETLLHFLAERGIMYRAAPRARRGKGARSSPRWDCPPVKSTPRCGSAFPGTIPSKRWTGWRKRSGSRIIPLSAGPEPSVTP